MTASAAWHDPVEVFTAVAAIEADDLVFLHSADASSRAGAFSYLAYRPIDRLIDGDWAAIRRFTTHYDHEPPKVFGYLGYERSRQDIAFPLTSPSPIDMPRSVLTAFESVIVWDHDGRSCRQFGAAGFPALRQAIDSKLPPVIETGSNMDRRRYLSLVEETKRRIEAGEFYQANLTRKFHGVFKSAPDSAGLFRQLLQKSPSPYAAYLRVGDRHIVSSSPESFLSIVDGRVRSRPIKGTRRRDPLEGDEDGRSALAASEKDRAENLMIVDLMRNDLARCCEPGSIAVDRLFETDSYTGLHHLSSTVSGRLRSGIDATGALRETFPPGSMTGAPKIAAMRWIAEAEGIDRGVYSGVLGWTGIDRAEWSVVIRTLLIEGDRFEFQVGGGIVADSDPESEWRETLVKAGGILAALGLDESAIAAL